MVFRWPIEIDALPWFTMVYLLKMGGSFHGKKRQKVRLNFWIRPSIYPSCPWLDRCVPLGYFRAKPAARPEARYAPSTSLRPASATKSTRKAPDSWCFMFLHNQIHPNSTNHLGAPFRLCALPECPWVKSRPPHQGRAPKTHGFFGAFLKRKSRGNRVFVAANWME